MLERERTVHFDLFLVGKKKKKKRKLISPNFTLLKGARLLCSFPSNPPCLQQVNALGWGTPRYTRSSTPEATGKLNFGKTTLLLQ